MQKSICIVIAYVLLFVRVSFSNQNIRYVGIEKGLSNNAVTSIYKDVYGFMWIGTYDGLNRYDGSVFRSYRNIWGDPGSLNDNHINKIAGFGNKIFVGTLKGLVFYNYKDSKFHPVMYSQPNSAKLNKIGFGISALCISKSGTIYIGTEFSGLFIYNVRDKVARQVPLPGGSNDYGVQSITMDRDGKVLVFIRNIGLCRFEKDGKGMSVLNKQLRSAGVLAIDSNNNAWIGTDNGLFKYNFLSKQLRRFLLCNGTLSSANIADMEFSKNADLIVGTDGGGVDIIDTAKHKLICNYSARTAPEIIKSDAIRAVFQDDELRIWIATLRGGINVIDNAAGRFTTISHDPLNKNSVVNNFGLSFCEDEAQNLWIGTDGGGLSYWDRKSGQFTNYIHQESRGSLAGNYIVSIVKDRENRIWIGMFNGGIDRFDKQTHRFVHYSCLNPVTGIEDKNLWKLYVDSHNKLWAGTTKGGALYCYNSQKDSFEIYDDKLTNIHAICEDSKGNLWMGDYSGLIKIDPLKHRYSFIQIKSAVRSITEDRQGNLWIGSEGGGLLKFDPVHNNLKRYTQQDGLPSNSILNVVTDNRGNIWGSTYNGLTEYNVVTGKFKNFYASDGLQSNQFNFNAAAKLKSGELIFGGINGFNIFYPDSITQKIFTPTLRLTDLKVNNKSIEGDAHFTGGHAIVDLKNIVLPFNKGSIAIDYTALEYSFSDKLKYAYYLECWDHGWNNVGSLKTAYYTRLDEGKYKLHVRVTNTEGSWSPDELLLQITVLPPWYRTWWAYMSYLTVICSVVYAFWLYRIRQTRLRYEVEIANLKVEREKELNEKKLSFFTNVAHEFRTPLTLIINPIKDLLDKEEGQHKPELTTVYRNSRRLLGLVDHLLLFRKTESENDTLNLSNVDFACLCKEVYLCFSQQAKFKKIKYDFHSSSECIRFLADREKIEIAVFNLISNALKFTPPEGEIQVVVDETHDNVLFEVADSGCGISQIVGDKLFDKFYQLKDNTSLKTGFGIGLYLVKTFIESHKGTIAYRSNSIGGTTFTIDIPKGDLKDAAKQADQNDQHLIDELIDSPYDVEEDAVEEDVNNLELLISDKQSILVIDDNSQIRGYIRKIFKDDYKILEADNGEAGLEIIKRNLPEIVISDVLMGELSGIELCRIIKQDTSLSHIPVILLTGDPNPISKLKGIEVGAVDFVSKPFEKEILLARVQGILRDRRELQNYFYNEVTLKGNPRNISSQHKDFLYRCTAIIENYLIDPEFDVKVIADEIGMSYSTLFKKIKSISGLSVNSFVRFIRLRKAAELMINTNCNVNESAFNTGFNDIKYFREHFIRQFGIKPSEFIRKHRTAFNTSPVYKKE